MTAADIADAAGVVGVVMILAAYAGATAGRLNAQHPVALLANLIGAGLILYSLTRNFNLPAFLMEAAWALVAFLGLVRVVRNLFAPKDPAPGPEDWR
ncbi:MAG TPA: hypothetical protein VF122_01500 [Caulobacteraceae bacterium]